MAFVTERTLHFEILNAMPQVLLHSTSFVRSSWSVVVSALETISLYKRQSSAKSLTVELMLQAMSFIKIRKSIGPITVP